MTVTRLIGGLTPADGADPRTFPTIFNSAADDIEQAEAEINVLQAGIISVASSTGGTAALDFASGAPLISHTISGAAVTITGSNYTVGSSRTVRLSGGTAVASLTVPSDWVFVGNAAGTAIGTATTVIVTATSFGTAATNVVAAYAEEA